MVALSDVSLRTFQVLEDDGLPVLMAVRVDLAIPRGFRM